MRGPCRFIRAETVHLLGGIATSLLLLFSPASAQEVGGIRGVVTDVDFNAPLPAVQISAEGVGKSTQTDADGRFVIQGVPPGKYSISVAREGYARKLVTDVLVTAGAMQEVEVALTGDVVDLEDFVVGSEDLVSGSPANLMDLRQNLTSFVDSIGSEMIKLTGASDAGAALRRVVGTSVVGKKYVVVRGLADRYNTVTLNGLRVPSSDPDKRAVNVDLFPGSLISAINNTKTFSPELPSESTGGNVDIRLKSRVDKPYATGSFKLGYNTNATGNPNFLTYNGPHTGIFGTRANRKLPEFLEGTNKRNFGLEDVGANQESILALRRQAAKALDPTTGVTTGAPPEDISLNLEAGTRLDFFGKPLSILSGFTYSKEYRFDPMEISGRVPADTGNESQIFDQQVGVETLLSALFLNFGYELDADHRIRLTAFTNIAAEDVAAFRVSHLEGAPDRVFTPYKNRSPFDSPNFGVTIQEALQYTERRLKTLQLSGEHAFQAGGSFEWGASYNLSSQDQPDSRFNSGGDQEGGTPIERVWTSLTDDSYNIRMDYKVPLFGSDGSKSAAGEGPEKKVEFRAGVNFDHLSRDYRSDNLPYNFVGAPVPQTISPDDRLVLTPADQVGRSALSNPATFLYRESAFAAYAATQQIFAGYGGLSIDVTDRLNATVGARVEVSQIEVGLNRSDAEIRAADEEPSNVFFLYDLVTNTVPASTDVIRFTKISATDVLPSFTANWGFATDMKLKLGISRTVARPSFKELAAVYTRIPASLSRFVGNYRLLPSEITNYDVRYEWYPNPGDIVAVSLFSKFIENPIEFADAGSISYFVNEESAYVYGFELETSRNLGGISEMLRPFTLTANYSRTFSRVELSPTSKARRSQLPSSRRLQAQPDYILNVGAIYDNKSWGLNAGVFLNVVGEFLWAAGGDGGNFLYRDAYQQPLTSLDAVISKKLAGNVKLTVRAQNLTNATTLRLYDNGRLYSQRREGQNFSLSLSGEW